MGLGRGEGAALRHLFPELRDGGSLPYAAVPDSESLCIIIPSSVSSLVSTYEKPRWLGRLGASLLI